MQKILLTTDLDARSDRALDRAIMISTALSAELYILHVVEKTWPFGAEKAALSEINNLVQISQNIHRVSKEGQVLVPKIKVIRGKPAKEIVKEIKSIEPDLVVMGRGKDFTIEKIIIGTTVEKVIAKSDKPILVVKARPSAMYETGLVAFDNSLGSRSALELMLKIAPEANLVVVNAAENALVQGEALENIEDQMQGRSLKIIEEIVAADQRTPDLQVVVDVGVATDVVLRRVAEMKPDLVACGRTGKTGLKSLLPGTTAQVLLGHLNCDVLLAGAR